MSKLKPEEKSCYNCKHRYVENNNNCYCDIDDHYIGYVISMSYSCEKWEVKNEVSIQKTSRE